MGTFKLGEVGEYTPQAVMPNDFLNERLESKDYGIYYSVQFEGDADTFLLQAKKPPVVGEVEYGMIEMAKSGKSKRFKRVKREDSVGHSKSSEASDKPFKKDPSLVPVQLYNGSLNYAKEAGLNLITDKEDRRLYLEYIMEVTEELLLWIDNIRDTDTIRGSQSGGADAVPTPSSVPSATNEPKTQAAPALRRAVTANELESLQESLDDTQDGNG